MRKNIYIFILAILVLSCGNNISKSKGELVGIKGKKYYPEKPYGMVLVPGGSFIMGKSDDDLAAVNDAPTKTVSVRSFYMDETEITNAEYRQFVRWVRDSVIRTKLAEYSSGIEDVEDPMYQFMYKNEKRPIILLQLIKWGTALLSLTEIEYVTSIRTKVHTPR